MEADISDSPATTRCGFVAIIGKPNVGKSTLLNYLIGQKLSITSRKPQTTRHKLLGIKTVSNTQMVFVDTPGLHNGQNKAINRYMNKTVQSVIHDVDLTLFMVDRLKWTAEDDLVLDQLRYCSTPVFLLLNKVDLVDDKSMLLPYIEELGRQYSFAEIFPISALKEHNIDALEKVIAEQMPENPFLYPKEQLTDRLFLISDEVTENAIEVYVGRLRKKLAGSNVTIETVRGIGYRLVKDE